MSIAELNAYQQRSLSDLWIKITKLDLPGYLVTLKEPIRCKERRE